MAEQITFYGKGGAGKTTLAANLSAALAEAGKRVMLVGCDLKADSGTLIHGNLQVPTLFDYVSAGVTPELGNIVVFGYQGIACVEVGDTFADDQCATRSIGRALGLLRDLDPAASLQLDYIVYDTPGEFGCADLATHLNIAERQHCFIVTSGDLMSFYAANSFIRSISRQPGVSRTSIIANALAGSFEESFVKDFACQVNARIAALIPRSLVVRHSELYGKTVIESAPDSAQSCYYRNLAHKIADERVGGKGGAPTPLAVAEIKTWARGWGDRLGELEFGIIQDGAGI
jgi:nitrogenase iron protein NifH